MESGKSEKRTDGRRLQCWAGSGKKEERQPWHYSPAAAAPGGPPFSRAARGRRAREEDGMARRGGAVRTSEKRGDRRDKKEPNTPRAAVFDRNIGTAWCSIYSEYSSFRIAPF